MSLGKMAMLGLLTFAAIVVFDAILYDLITAPLPKRSVYLQ